MQIHRVSRTALVGWILGTVAINFTTEAWGEAVTDGTLGPVQSFSGDFTVDASVGQSLGSNLFHSFDNFSVWSGESATFTGPSDINSIITRVTGYLSGTLEPSTIDGPLISEIPGANFWFINPAGVIFGPDASIDLSGSFHASTASEVRFPDGKVFSAVNPGGPYTLSVASPEAFGFLNDNPASIELEQAVIGCGPDDGCTRPKEVSIIGGSIDMTEAKILPETMGVVRIVSIAEAGEVEITPTGVVVDEITEFNDITMVSLPESEVMEVAVDGPGAGRIVIRGKSLYLRDSFISTNNTGVPNADDKGIDIRLTGPLQMDGAAISSVTINVGNAAPIVVHASGIEMYNNSSVRTDSFEDEDATPVSALGNAGDILLDGGDQLVIISGFTDDAQTEVTSKAKETAGGIAGNAGSIKIIAGEFHLLQGANIGTTNFSRQGEDAELSAGDVTIHADNILIDGDIDIVPRTDEGNPRVTAVFANVKDPKTKARGGNVRLIATQDITVTDGAQIQVGASGIGDSGTITLKASGVIRIDDQAELISASTQSKGGDVRLEDAHSIILENSTVNAVVNSGEKPGGNINIFAERDILIRGTTIETTTNSSGQAGDVTISAGERVSIDDGSRIKSRGENGASGRITVSSKYDITVSGATLSGETAANVDGNRIRLDAGNDLHLMRGALITTRSDGGGNAGNIELAAGGVIDIANSRVLTEAEFSSGGNITLTTPSIIELFKSRIASSVFGPAGTQGGNILIDDTVINPRFLILNDGNILAQAFKGRGGNIQIKADYVIETPNSGIDASSQRGIDGTVLVAAPELDLEKGLLELPVMFVDAASQVRQSCEARYTIGENEFTVASRDGLPPNPAGLMPAFYALSPDRKGVNSRLEGEQLMIGGMTSPLSAPLAIVCNRHQ